MQKNDWKIRFFSSKADNNNSRIYFYFWIGKYRTDYGTITVLSYDHIPWKI